ncbi:protein of unknown function DUF885 [Novosphingobium aromaticivorans DSM 12444]|uniref:DUF885 domain-containing protein n=1 Tax=Novosphingobium aromaticivorans (strain ATCC 700278 / DSM 12444 / CCUG 56034 / CIP 105152 / NBRC 16084 / F199) TaxID=279238 RepID=Q2G5T1_NOVAD|nr:DUF885 domain-containing protein [Novosphingobium aromaticivorans]ABD26792.1 protein of unknown function DUF885 [Novosphingobium aromaticivorans DSM 12444]SCY42268.1 Uncharacterized conserved protein, DUF885 familyt [Novosphingobium aromaticivorans]
MALTRRVSTCAIALAIILAGCAPATARTGASADTIPTARIDAAPPPLPVTSANVALDRLFAEDAQVSMQLDPLGSLEQGHKVPVERFVLLFTPELIRERREANARSLAELARIDPAKLDRNRRISRAVFEDAKRNEQALLAPDVQPLFAAQPFNHFGGFHVAYPELSAPGSGIALDTVEDYRLLIARHKALPQVFGQAIARFREGMASGVTEPRLTVDNMIVQIDALLAQPVDRSPFLAPARQFPDDVPAAERARLARELATVARREIYPAYRTLRRFLANEYRPVAREQVGLSALPDGERLYRLLARQHTTVDLDPAAVHELGLSEVARIQSEMEDVKRQLGFQGPLRSFFDHIRTDPKYHPHTERELAEGFRAVGRKVDALAPQYFLHLPLTPLLIQPYPAYRARFEAGGSYAQGSADGKQPGVFFYNTYDLKSRFLTGVTTLYLHEGAPGHHFQISLAQENANLPDFQRFGGNTAYIEGWALYAETLGYEMGFYKDPMQHWGTLDDEMLRAMRLVVDTGLHTRGWSREEAVDYMLANSGMGRTDAQAEVDRYIANPGQALAYKIGALTIQRLRREAEAALGRRFDIRQFHDQILGSGALPMPVLEAKVRGWIAATR